MLSPGRYRPALLLALLTGVAAALRFPWLVAERLWYDEVFSAFVAAHDLREVLRLAIDDQTNPPGFYYLLGAWARLGSFDDAWLRALPAIAGTLTPAIAAVAGRAAGLSWRTALLGGLLVAASPLLIEMSLEVRTYSLLALVATAALALTATIVRRTESPSRREVMTLGALNLVLASLHVFGFVAVMANTLAGLLAGPMARPRAMLRRGRPLLVATLPAVLLLMAWLGLVAAAATDQRFAGNAAWVPSPGLASLASFSAHVLGHFESMPVAWAVAAVLLGAITWVLVRPSRSEAPDAPGTRMLVVAALFPPLAVIALYLVTSRSLWLPRYLVATIPPLALVVAAAVQRVRAPWRAGVATLAVGWTLLAGMHSISAGPGKPDWASIVRELGAGRSTTVCVLEGYVGLPLRHYAVRQGLPVHVRDASECSSDPTRMWAVYRPGTESAMRRRLAGAELGPEISLSGGLTVTVARRVTWPER